VKYVCLRAVVSHLAKFQYSMAHGSISDIQMLNVILVFVYYPCSYLKAKKDGG
jgi:hypothetical protein